MRRQKKWNWEEDQNHQHGETDLTWNDDAEWEESEGENDDGEETEQPLANEEEAEQTVEEVH